MAKIFGLGLRAWSRGWASYFEPGDHVLHQEKGSIEVHTKQRRIKTIQRRNRYFLEWIHFPLPALVLVTLPISMVQLFGEILLMDRANITAFFMALIDLPKVHRARVALQQSRLAALEQIIEKVS